MDGPVGEATRATYRSMLPVALVVVNSTLVACGGTSKYSLSWLAPAGRVTARPTLLASANGSKLLPLRVMRIGTSIALALGLGWMNSRPSRDWPLTRLGSS